VGTAAPANPADVEAYRMLAHIADTVAVVRALGSHIAVVVGLTRSNRGNRHVFMH
jgi:hypothetical protein